jgi:hypothetical protein
MRLVAFVVCAASLSCTLTVALSQQAPADPDPLQLAVRTNAAATRQGKDDHPQIIDSFEYTRSHQDRVVRELIAQIDLHDNIQRAVELKTLNESPLSTALNLSRFLTSRGYKRADGSPLIDLSF